MAETRVVQGRPLTPTGVAEVIENDRVEEVIGIQDADRACPDCNADVLVVVYRPSGQQTVTGWKCTSCDWHQTEPS